MGQVLDELDGVRTFTCPRCHAVTFNPVDVREKYCGSCHDWTGCPHDPLFYKQAPIGMYRCPVCGCMILGRVEHLVCDPEVCGLHRP